MIVQWNCTENWDRVNLKELNGITIWEGDYPGVRVKCMPDSMHVNDSFKQEPLCFSLFVCLCLWHHFIMAFSYTLSCPCPVDLWLSLGYFQTVWFPSSSLTPFPSASSAPPYSIYLAPLSSGFMLSSLNSVQWQESKANNGKVHKGGLNFQQVFVRRNC